jgi:hypothetical protein
MTLPEHVLRRLIESAQRKPAEVTPVVAVRDEQPPAAAFTLRAAGQDWRAVPVRSTLQARRALLDAKAEQPVLLLSAVGESELGEEVLARVSQRRLHSAEHWALLRELFGAEEQTPDLSEQSWIAKELIARNPAGGYPRVPAGILDLEFAWGALIQALGLTQAIWTKPGLMEALVGRSGAGAPTGAVLDDLWPTLSEALRQQLGRRLGERVGAFGRTAVALVAKGQGRRALEWGLLAELVASSGAGDPLLKERLRLQIQLEPFAADPGALAEWAAAARQCFEALPVDGELRRRTLQGAEQQLRAFGAAALIPSSPLLPGGIEARVADLARALRSLLAEPARKRHREALEQQVGELLRDIERAGEPWRGARRALEALVRLARWLRARPEERRVLSELAEVQNQEWAAVDGERRRLAQAELPASLAPAVGELLEAVGKRRDALSAPFAAALARSFAGQEGPGELCFSEALLEGPVAALAKKHRLLLVVLDGMSAVEFEALAADLVRGGTFERIAPAPRRRWPPVLAPLPTVTEACRTSLLCGRLTVGDAGSEVQGFGELARRQGWISAKAPVPLFHKGGLSSAAPGLAAELQESLAGEARVVAVVLNAIDDWLKQGGQVRLEWGLEAIPLLAALAVAASMEGRLLVLTADHGHVLDRPGGRKDSEGAEGGERWRSAERAPEAGETRFEGPRVLLPKLGGPVVLPSIEGLRYAAKASGYHGGATAQEVVVPLGVFVPRQLAEDLDAGYGPEVLARPWWWDSPEDPREGREPFDAAAEPDGLRRSQGDLFSAPERRSQSALVGAAAGSGASVAGERPAWIARLLKSSLFKSQKEVLARQRPQDQPIADLLALLDASGGTLPRRAIGSQLGLLDAKLDSLLSLARRLLNYDGTEVLREAEGDVVLHVEALFQQFGLGGPGR